MSSLRVPSADPGRQYAMLRAEIEAAISRVLASGWYILGNEVQSFEQEFAAFCGVRECVGVASGADALYLALAALGIGPGDEVITVANACTYQVAAILQAGAEPVLVDIDPRTHNLHPDLLASAIGPRTRAVLPVHLYGRMADMSRILSIAAQHHLAVVEDAAQAHGAWLPDETGTPRRAGGWGTCACYSFYPTKNLGAIGDGGAVVTNDTALAERLRHLRQYGWSSKYIATEDGGRNSRLDELQAAVLRVKLGHLEGWNSARRERAAWYAELLSDAPLELPHDEAGHVYHLYVVASEQRDALRQHLTAEGIGCDIHYPRPVHLQPVYRHRFDRLAAAQPEGAGWLPHSERMAQRILSLPLYPELSRAEVERVAAAIRAWGGR